MREQGMTSAHARGRSEPHGTRADEARLANLPDRGSDGYAPHTRPAGDPAYVRVGSRWAYVCLLAGLADRGISSAIPPGGPGTRAWYWARSPPSTSRRRTSRKQGFAGRKGPQAPLPVF